MPYETYSEFNFEHDADFLLKSGNIILTDADLKILALSRNVSEGDGQETQRVGSQYCIDNRQNFLGAPPISRDRVEDALRVAAEKHVASQNGGLKPKSKPGADLRKSLAVSITEVPPILIDHILEANGFDTSLKPAEILDNDTLLNSLVQNLSQARELVDNITCSSNCTGYIFAKRQKSLPKDPAEPADTDQPSLLYDDFHPFIPTKFKDNPAIEVLQYDDYNRTVDEFFSSLEGQKLENRVAEREAMAQKKLASAKQDQAKKIEGLQFVQSEKYRKAAAIEANIERVQEAMDAVNSLIAQGMDWVDIGKLVEREKGKANPVAQMIQLPLNLSENTITLLLAEEDDEAEEEDPFETDDSESESDGHENTTDTPTLQANAFRVDILLTLSPWGNAREYYGQRKSAAVKEEKTHMQAEKALRSTEQKINEGLKKALKQEKALLQPIRNPLWFEKFFWFVSSDGYLVIGGKDKSQDELIYRKHLRKGDVYCHADVKDACVVVVKNDASSPDSPIPPATLAQASHLVICSSEAWDSKAGIGAWWVNTEQVSKFAAAGDLLPMGVFNIQGDKNFLPPGQLLLGLGVMFRISDESSAKRTRNRVHDSNVLMADVQLFENESHPAKESTNPNSEGAATSGEVLQKTQKLEEAEETRENIHPKESVDAARTPNEQVEETGNQLGQLGSGILNLEVKEDAKAPSHDITESNLSAQDDDTTMSTAGITETQGVGSMKQSAAQDNKRSRRGQRGKAKKIATKYKDQDEEDRAAAEALIGATFGKQKAEAAAEAKAQREFELEEAKARRRAQHERKQRAAAEHEEKRRLMLENTDVPDDEEGENTVPLEELVGTPKVGDEILEAIAVCAPWSALGRFKYKVKMQPGPLKKGKAVKEIVERWKSDAGKKGVIDEKSEDSEKMWPREVALIKTLKPEDMINTVPAGKVRVMMSGGAAASNKGGGGKAQGKGGKGKSKK